MSKKVLFSVYGYGLGHATRCHAIINELMNRGVTVKILASDNAYDYFKKLKFDTAGINSFQVGSNSGSFSWVQTLFQNIDLPFNMFSDYYKIKRLVNDFNPDAMISDTEPVSVYSANNLELPCIFLSNLVPTLMEYPNLPDEVKNNRLSGQHATINAFFDFVLKNCRKILSPTLMSYKATSNLVFTDLISRSKPNQLESVAKLRIKLGVREPFYLVSFGGAKITKSYYNTILPVLKNIKSNFIVSTNHAVSMPTKLKNLMLYPFLNNFLDYLKACEGVICLSGHSTLSENLVFGKPSFVIPIRDHIEQLGNASIISRMNYGMVNYIKDEINVNDLENGINEFINRKDYYQRKAKNSGYKGLGAGECAQAIIDSL